MPQLQCVISVVEVRDGLEASRCDVVRQAEGAVGQVRHGPSHQLSHPVHPKGTLEIKMQFMSTRPQSG